MNLPELNMEKTKSSENTTFSVEEYQLLLGNQLFEFLKTF